MDKKSFVSLNAIPVHGFVNAMQFFVVPANGENIRDKGSIKLAVATGQEHRLGRWWHVPTARNEVSVISFGDL